MLNLTLLYFKSTGPNTGFTRRPLSLTIDEGVSDPLSLLPALLPDCYFSCGRAETALRLDVALPTNTALCIIKHCMRSPEETHIMFCIFVVRAVHKCTAQVGNRKPTLIACEGSLQSLLINVGCDLWFFGR